jgi:hypothetical protein
MRHSLQSRLPAPPESFDALQDLCGVFVLRLDKQRENAAALEVLPDLLREVDALAPADRLASLVQGVS